MSHWHISIVDLVLIECQLIGVTSGLNYLHDHGIVHKNLMGVSRFILPPTVFLHPHTFFVSQTF